MIGNRANRPTGGPGRGDPRARATGRPGVAKRSSSPKSAPSPVPPKKQKQPRALRLTRKAIVLIAIVALLAITYAKSLQTYFGQQIQISQIRASNAQKQQSIDQLKDEVQRWNDPEYVRAQIRSRLGWVVPGETGYRVIGADGKPIGKGVKLDRGLTPEELVPWWQKLWVSAKAADEAG